MSATEVRANQPDSFWKNRNYLLLWAGQVVSAVGTQVSDLAFPLLVLALTHSAVQAGFVGALGTLPYFVFSLPAGALVDRWNRKRVMMLCDTVRALALGSIPLAFVTGHLTLLQLYLVSLIEGTLFVFFNIAEVSCLPRVVRKEHLPTVASLTEVTNSLSSLFGRSLGGIFYSVGQFVPFLADSCSYLVSVISLCFVNVPFQEQREASRRALWLEIREGLLWLWHQPVLFFIALVGCIVHIIGSGMILMVIVLAQQQHASSFVIGLILGVGGVGTLAGALLGGLLQKRFSFAYLTISTLWLSALLFPLFFIATNSALLAMLVAAISGIITIYGVVQFGYRLAIIPDELQGRVNSVFRLIVFGGDPIGLALAGVLLQLAGPVTTVLIYAAGLVALALVTTLNRHLRAAKKPVE